MVMTKAGEKNSVKAVCNLSNREKEILQLAAQGISNKEIAGICCIKVTTVKTHFSNIRKKLEGQKKSSGSISGKSPGIANQQLIFFRGE